MLNPILYTILRKQTAKRS